MERLTYHGKRLTLVPTVVLCLTGNYAASHVNVGDLADLRRMITDGYALVITLEPGDATRYQFLVTPLVDGFAVARFNYDDRATGAVSVHWRAPLDTPIDACVALAPTNDWSQELFAWWIEAFRAGPEEDWT